MTLNPFKLICRFLYWLRRQLGLQPQLSQPVIFSARKPQPSKRLINLMYGDHVAASRLLSRTKSQYPGKSAKWVNERVVEDLIRDRSR